jgi:hypothetical protein
LAIGVTAAVLALAGEAVLGSASTTTRAAGATIVAPTEPRTIGTNCESTMIGTYGCCFSAPDTDFNAL